LNHVDLEDGVSLGGVEDDDVQPGFCEEGEALAIGGTRADCGGSVELLAVTPLRRQRVRLVFEEIGASEEGDEVTLGVDDGEFAFLESRRMSFASTSVIPC